MFNASPKKEVPRPRLASAAPVHPQEFDRLVSVCGLAVCDRGFDPTLDGIAQQAADLCGLDFGLVTLIREEDQIFLGRAGIDGHSTVRDEAICAHTILADETFVVEDIQSDPRFAGLPIATQPPFVRCYAGAPIRDRNGLPLGSLCTLGLEPCVPDSRRLFALARLAAMAGVVLETRRFAVELLGPLPRPGATDAALTRLDRILAPLLDGSNGFRSTGL